MVEDLNLKQSLAVIDNNYRGLRNAIIKLEEQGMSLETGISIIEKVGREIESI